jgi:hypothetical protein
MFLVISAAAVFLGLEETHESLRQKPDMGRRIGQFLLQKVFRRSQHLAYAAIPTSEGDAIDASEQQSKSNHHKEPKFKRRKLPVKRMFTRNVVVCLIAHGLMATHVGTFNNAWFLFLSTSRYDPKHPDPEWATEQNPPFRFTGGMAMPPATIGLALSILGAIGIFTQLVVYPYLSGRLGVARSYRYFLTLFPIAYLLAPYIALLPSSTPPPKEAGGIFIWMGIVVVLAIQVLARTFALPGMTILVNNSCPHPTVLGTLHGVAQSISSGMRTIGPALTGYLYGQGLQVGVVGVGFWFLAAVACIGLFAGSFVRDGSGHDIILEGEEQELDELPKRTSR